MRDHNLALEFGLQQVIPGSGRLGSGLLPANCCWWRSPASQHKCRPSSCLHLCTVPAWRILHIGEIILFENTASLAATKLSIGPPHQISKVGLSFSASTRRQGFAAGHAHIVDRDAVLGLEFLFHSLAPLFLRRAQHVELSVSDDERGFGFYGGGCFCNNWGLSCLRLAGCKDCCSQQNHN